MLAEKYGITDINEAYRNIDFRNKTIFVDKSGNDITTNYLTYQQGDLIIEAATSEPLG